MLLDIEFSSNGLANQIKKENKLCHIIFYYFIYLFIFAVDGIYTRLFPSSFFIRHISNCIPFKIKLSFCFLCANILLRVTSLSLDSSVCRFVYLHPLWRLLGFDIAHGTTIQRLSVFQLRKLLWLQVEKHIW